MSYVVEFTKKAQKTLDKLDNSVRRRIAAAVDQLSVNPYPADVEPVKTMPGHFRTKCARDWRIVYTVQGGKLLVTVVEIWHRSEAYR